MNSTELGLLIAGVVALALAAGAALVRLRHDRVWLRWLTGGGALAAVAIVASLLVIRGQAAGQVPIATVFDALALLAATLLVLYFVMSLSLRGPVLGAFLLPLALLVAVAALALSREASALRDEAPYAGTVVHVGLTLGGVAALAVGGLCGLMYLAQQRRLRRGSTDRLSGQLPSLERLERLNRRAIIVGFPLLSAGLALGLVMLGHRGRDLGLTFFDAKVIASLAAWAVFAVLVAVGLRPRFRGTPVAYLTVVAFVLMVLTMVGIGHGLAGGM